ncbi:hypothetical protein [uncultured Brevibacillus sp.]|uniref:hypothetical protein n=1 Tax=uncultured Brevibacillus sp. TaxID=169970 RepID=UPI0025992866|nr:hypothetical protein [uncultured Brevibacillus sp.]
MDNRKTVDIGKLITAMKDRGMDTSKVEVLLEEIRTGRNNNPTTAKSEVIKNTYTA